MAIASWTGNPMSLARYLLVFVLLAMFAWSTNAQTQIAFTDQDFKDADWTSTILIDQRGRETKITVSQRLRGGNPGSYRRIQHEADPGDETQLILVVHLAREAIYDPQTNGPIASISYGYDLINLESSMREFTMYHLVLLQNGTYYESRTPDDRALFPRWTTVSGGSLSLSDFTRLVGDGPRHPDFSANSPPLQFGFASATNFAGDELDLRVSRLSGIDNWLVAVSTPGPPPAELDVTSNSALPGGTAGQSYSSTLSATGGTAPLTWSTIAGALPPGLTLDSDTASIEGVPAAPGEFLFTALVAEAEGTVFAKEFLIRVQPDPTLEPQLAVRPERLSFWYAQGAQPAFKKLFIPNEGGGSLDFQVEVASGGSWLTVSQADGVATAVEPGMLDATANPASLAPGTYYGEIIISNTAADESVTVQVTMAITRRQQMLRLSQQGLTFSAVTDGVAPIHSFDVFNDGSGVMAWNIELKSLSGGDWLAAIPRVGASDPSNPSTAEVRVRKGGLDPGVYYALLEVAAPDAGNSSQTIPVVLNLLPAWWRLGPVFEERSLIISVAQGDPLPPQQILRILNPSGREMSFTVQVPTLSGGPWLASAQAEGTLLPSNFADLSVKVSPGDLGPGVYRGFLIILFEDGTQRTADVRLVVTPSVDLNSKTATVWQDSCIKTLLAPVFRVIGTNAPVQAGLPTNMEVGAVDDCGRNMTEGSVVVDFANIASPSISLEHSGDGVWTGTWNVPGIDRPSVASVTVTATDAKGITSELTDTVSIEPSSVSIPRVVPGAVVHGASFQQDPLAPGTLVSIFGQGPVERARDRRRPARQ